MTGLIFFLGQIRLVKINGRIRKRRQQNWKFEQVPFSLSFIAH